jgi:hypothetical protein
MTGKVNSRVLDLGLNVLDTESTHLHICSAEPVDYADVLTKSLGNKNFGVGNVCGSPVDATPNGRKVTTAAVTDGSVTGTGTATWWAVVDATNTRLLADNALAASQGITAGNVFSLPAFDIRLPSVGA